jgi:trigger factor
MPKLNIQREDVAPCRVKLTVELPVERVASVHKDSVARFNRQAPIKGFRPGKIPAKILLGRFGEAIAEHAKGELLEAGLREAIEQSGLEPESRPVVENEKALRVLPGESFVFAFAFDVAPEFELPDYKGIEVTRDTAAVSDDSVSEWIDTWLQRQAHYAKVDRPAAEGDLLKASYKAVLPEGGEEPPASAKFYIEAEDTWLPLRQPELLPGVTTLLAGSVAGDEKDIEVTFPEDHGEESLAGRTFPYHVSISEVHGLEKPELDDDLAQKVGMDTAEQIRERVRENLDVEKKREQDRVVRDQVVRALTANLDFALPSIMLNRTVANVMQRLREEQARGGAQPEDAQKSHDEMLARANQRAREELVRFYVLQKIAEAEDIKVEAKDLDQALDMFAEMQRATPKVVLRRLRDSGRLNELLLNLREAKTVDRLVELAKVNETEGEPGDAKP